MDNLFHGKRYVIKFGQLWFGLHFGRFFSKASDHPDGIPVEKVI
jgi:hypothetical protein